MNTQRISLDEATDVELQIASRGEGIKNHLVEAEVLTPRNRVKLLTMMKQRGFTLIDIDPDNRLTEPYALAPFYLAVAHRAG